MPTQPSVTKPAAAHAATDGRDQVVGSHAEDRPDSRTGSSTATQSISSLDSFESLSSCDGCCCSSSSCCCCCEPDPCADGSPSCTTLHSPSLQPCCEEGVVVFPPCWPRWSAQLVDVYSWYGTTRPTRLAQPGEQREDLLDRLKAYLPPVREAAGLVDPTPAPFLAGFDRPTFAGRWWPKAMDHVPPTPSSASSRPACELRKPGLEPTSCPTCKGKASSSRGSQAAESDHGGCHVSTLCSALIDHHGDGRIFDTAVSLASRPEQLRALLEACRPFVTVRSYDCVRFAAGLRTRCLDWMFLLSLTEEPPPHADLERCKLALDLQSLRRLVPSRRVRTVLAALLRTPTPRHFALDARMLRPDAGLYDTLLVFRLGTLRRCATRLDNVALLVPELGTLSALFGAMLAVKLELLYRVRRRTGVPLPHDAVQHRSSVYVVQALTHALDRVAMHRTPQSCLDTALRRSVYGLYARGTADLLDDCAHLRAILAIVPERFACLACPVCSTPTRRDPSPRTAFFNDAAALLARMQRGVAASPDRATAERRLAFLRLVSAVVAAKATDVQRELALQRERGPLGYHLVQLKRKGVERAGSTDRLVDDVYSAMEDRPVWSHGGDQAAVQTDVLACLFLR